MSRKMMGIGFTLLCVNCPGGLPDGVAPVVLCGAWSGRVSVDSPGVLPGGVAPVVLFGAWSVRFSVNSPGVLPGGVAPVVLFGAGRFFLGTAPTPSAGRAIRGSVDFVIQKFQRGGGVQHSRPAALTLSAAPRARRLAENLPDRRTVQRIGAGQRAADQQS